MNMGSVMIIHFMIIAALHCALQSVVLLSEDSGLTNLLW